MAYMVCHAEKLSGFGMGFHIDRVNVYQPDGSVTIYPENYEIEERRGKSVYPEIKYPELHQWNRGEGTPASGLRAAWKKEVETLSRRPQKNTSSFVEFNVSAGGEFFEALRKQFPDEKTYFEKCEAYFKECRDVLDSLYPAGKTIKWSTHYEETTPHMHVLKMPIIEAPRKLNVKAKAEGKEAGPPVLKYSSGDFLGGIKGLIKLHDELFESVGKKWGLERGESGKDARHTNQAEWQRELARKEKAMSDEDKRLDAREKELIEKLDKMETYHREQKELADRRIKELDEKAAKREAELYARIKDKENTIKNREELIELKETDLNAIAAEKIGKDEGKKVIGSVVNVFRNEIIQPSEIQKFWPEFFKRLPGFVKEIIQDVRQSISAEKAQKKQEHTQTNTKGKGR